MQGEMMGQKDGMGGSHSQEVGCMGHLQGLHIKGIELHTKDIQMKGALCSI